MQRQRRCGVHERVRARRCSLGLMVVLLSLAQPGLASAYEVEADSSANTVFVLLRNLHPTADFVSLTLGGGLPGFVTAATAGLVPAQVAASGSDLAALEFDVSPTAGLGETGQLTLDLRGTADGKAIRIELDVPLEVVASAPEAQGQVGVGIPAPDPGGADADGDGVSDPLEEAFGSDPMNAASVPGKAAFPGVPGLGGLAALVLFAVFAGTGFGRLRARGRGAS